MVDIIDTPLRYFVTVDAKNAPVSFQKEYQRRIEQDGVEIAKPEIRTEDIPPEEFNLVFDHAAVLMAAEIQTAWGRVSDANAVIAEHTNEAVRLAAVVSSALDEKAQALSARDALAFQKENIIAERNVAFSERDAAIAEKEAALSEKPVNPDPLREAIF